MSTRISRTIVSAAGLAVILGIGGVAVAASAAQSGTPIPQSTAEPSSIDFDGIELREQEALELSLIHI